MTIQPPFTEVEEQANAPVERIGIDSPEYFAFWTAFRAAVDGQACTYADADERVTQYARQGHRIGRLFRPLPCVRER